MGIDSLLVRKSAEDNTDMPEYPGLYVTKHVLGKTAPLGFIGGSIIGGVGAIFGRGGLKWSSYGLYAGMLLGGVMLTKNAVQKENFDDDGVKDRAYRLLYNDAVRRYDEHVLYAVPVSMSLIPLMQRSKLPIFHKISISAGLAMSSCLIWMFKEVKEQKLKAGESEIRSMS